MQVTINKGTLELVEGDITAQEVEGIVNAANSGLRGGGGVDGAIHRAGGPAIMADCRRIGGCPTGQAVVTTAGNLKARKVIHTVGPVWAGGARGEPELLAGAYRSSLEAASSHGLRSVAFPSLSTGAYGYPLDRAARVALQTAAEYLRQHDDILRVRFVLFGQSAYEAFAEALQELPEA